MRSIIDTVILPMQNVLGLGSEARISCPGAAESNWESRLLPAVNRQTVMRKNLQ